MRRLWRVLAVLTTLSPGLFSDTTIVTRENVGGRDIVTTHYQRGADSRYEDGNNVMIFRNASRTLVRIDRERREYSELTQTWDPVQLFAASLYHRTERFSGKNLNVYWETVDTGERRQEFGMTARRLRISKRSVPEPGGCSQASERVEDGWFGVKLAGVKPGHYRAISFSLVAGSAGCQDSIQVHGRMPDPGMIPLHVTKTETYARGDTRSSTTDVLEYSAAALPDSTFEPPSGYRKVDARPAWSERLRMDWQQLGSAIQSWWN